jgi:uncharacterized protein (UPF0248 family)
MKPIHEVLNRILWDALEKPDEYVIGYYDRVQDKVIEIAFTDIARIEEGFIIIERGGEETMIPLHRVRIVKKKGEVVWQRSTTNNSA